MPKPVLNIADLNFTTYKHGVKYESESAPMSGPIGANLLGCNVTIVPPGKRNCPRHCHHANEEMFYILEGSGTYQLGEEFYPIQAGDLLCGPVGGPEVAHQIVNTSDAPLKYLAMSTMLSPDITEYPDSGKFGAFAGTAPGGEMQGRRFTVFAEQSSAVDYWLHEDD